MIRPMGDGFRAGGSGQGLCVISGGKEAHASTAEGLRDALSNAVAHGCSRVLVDLSETEAVDPLVLGAIIGAERRYRRLGAELALVCCHETAYADLDRAAVPNIIQVFQIRDEGLSWLDQASDRKPVRP
jgi:anti-anti-sigma regulatory factor